MGNSRSRTYFFWSTWNRTAASSPMAELTVPVRLEDSLALEDGSPGSPLSSVTAFDQREVPNLYSCTLDEFRFNFTEKGTAYGETESSQMRVETTLKVQGSPGFSLHFEPKPVTKWGINFAGSVYVRPSEGGRERAVYLPGTRTYDPAGLTGDAHASERIGPSCSRTQLAITLATLIAALRGAELEQINTLHEQVRPLIVRYHGRECLFDWMKLQVEQTVYQNRDVTPYPEFLKEQIKRNKVELNAAREHTRAYLKSYNEGRPHPPVQYFKKVAAKDKPEDLFNSTDLQRFNEIVQS